jgi:hypothetical protein
MFKKTSKSPQLDVFGNISSLLDENSLKQYNEDRNWHNQFREQIVMHINEESYCVLFSDKMGAPNSSIRILVSMMILKEAFGWSDSQLFEQSRFNLLVRSALSLFNITDSLPVNSTYYLLRKRIYEYEKKTGRDLLQETFSQITREQIKEFEVDGRSIRMDSKLIGSNIAYFSRYEVIHLTLCDYIKIIGTKALLRLSDADRLLINTIAGEESQKIVYRSTKDEIKSRMLDLGLLIYKILKVYSGDKSEQHQLLQRVFDEQYKVQQDQHIELRAKEEISSGSVQSPNDTDCAYANKKHTPIKGYSANITETCSDKGLNLITNVQVEKANVPDNSFVQSAIKNTEGVTNQKVQSAYMDGAFHSPDNEESCKGIDMVLTGLQGFQPRFDLEMTSEGLMVTNNQTGECTMAELSKKTKRTKQPRWRIPKEKGYYYFDEKAIIAASLRRKLKNRSQQELQKRNNVEASIFQLSYHLKKDKTRYRGIIKQRIWAVCRCLWINLVRIINFIKRTCQKEPVQSKNPVFLSFLFQNINIKRVFSPKLNFELIIFMFVCYFLLTPCL